MWKNTAAVIGGIGQSGKRNLEKLP